jgi:N-acetylneuraminic acid mutarotase
LRIRAVAIFAVLLLALLWTACGRDDPDGNATSVRAPPGSLAQARTGHTSTILPDDSVLVVGGVGPNLAVLASTEVYDPSTGGWIAGAILTQARVDHTATAMKDGRVLIVGGFQRDRGALSSAQMFDPSAREWSNTASMARARVAHSATLLNDGRVLIVGGTQLGRPSAEIYDGEDNAWARTIMEAQVDESHTATLMDDGRVLVVGFDRAREAAQVQIFDPSVDTWSIAGSPVTLLGAFHSASLLPDGRVLLSGGLGPGLQLLASSEVYDPRSDSWSPGAAMGDSRGGHSATLLPDGRVLVAGGGGRFLDGLLDTLDSVEVYDPKEESWSRANSLAQWRMFHATTVLGDGSVLVAGGQVLREDDGLFAEDCGIRRTCALVLSSTEVYDPSAGTWLSQGPAPPEDR